MKKNVQKLLFLGAQLLFIKRYKLLPTYPFSRTYNEHCTKSSTQKRKDKEKAEVLLDVPLESQFDSPSLENGCEVTSLSMLLSFMVMKQLKPVS